MDRWNTEGKTRKMHIKALVQGTRGKRKKDLLVEGSNTHYLILGPRDRTKLR
ncbi:MAG: hypothetical protein AB1847_10340 [bacterium]